MKITIFWTWYVWLVSWTCLAEVGHDVMCIDIDKDKVKELNNLNLPIYEPGLHELVKRNYDEWRLRFSTDAEAWVKFWKVIFSAVWTPPDEDHKADLKYVKAVAKTVWKLMTRYKVFVNKSTVPVGTWKLCHDIIQEEVKKRWNWIIFDVVSNPEFLREWMAVRDFMSPNRIVCGVGSKKAKSIMLDLYWPFVRYDRPLVFTDVKSSELIKYAANSFLATKISFINEMANFAEIVWANVRDVSRGIWLDERIGTKFLHPWIGYGGSCFPKDVKALIESWKENGFSFEIVNAAEKVNKKQKTKVIEKLKNFIPDLEWKTIAIWWLAFKPRTDDIREAPSVDVIKNLFKENVEQISAFDPVAMKNMEEVYDQNNIIFTHNNYEALKWADALLILTEWDEFRRPDFKRMLKLMEWNVIIDWRNIWKKSDINKYGFQYDCIWNS